MGWTIVGHHHLRTRKHFPKGILPHRKVTQEFNENFLYLEDIAALKPANVFTLGQLGQMRNRAAHKSRNKTELNHAFGIPGCLLNDIPCRLNGFGKCLKSRHHRGVAK